VFDQFWKGSDDQTTWVNKRRNTVLGRWHEIKMQMWEEHLHNCEQQAIWEAEQKRIQEDDKVPF